MKKKTAQDVEGKCKKTEGFQKITAHQIGFENIDEKEQNDIIHDELTILVKFVRKILALSEQKKKFSFKN